MRPDDFDNALERIEARFERLRVQYEDFFAGLETQEPATARLDLACDLEHLRAAVSGSSDRLRKLENLAERYRGYEQYWERRSGRATLAARQRRVVAAAVGARTSPGFSLDPAESAPPSSSPPSGVLTGARARLITPPLGTPASLSTLSSLPSSSPSSVPPPSSASTSSSVPPPSFASPPPSTSSSIYRVSRGSAVTTPSLAAQRSPTVPSVPPPGPSRPRKTEPSSDASSDGGPTRRGSGPVVISEGIRQLHAKLRACSPEQGQVSIERLAKALADTEAKLRAEHGDRTITFDVVVRNGKAMVKPVVR